MDRRENERVSRELVVPCQSEGRTSSVNVYDLSAGGACVEWLDEAPTIGARLVLKFEGVTSVIATLRWKTDRQGGCEFDNTLHPSVVAFLGFPDDDRDFNRITPCDASGQALEFETVSRSRDGAVPFRLGFPASR